MLWKRSRKRTGNQPETNSKLAVNFMNKLFLVRDIIGLNLLPSPPFPPLRFRFVSKKPPSPIPRIALKVASKRATAPHRGAPAPRINSRIFLFVKAQGDGASNSPTTSKWQLHLRRWHSPLSGGSDAKRRWGDDNSPPAGSRGSAPGTPLVTFVVKRKSPGCRAERLHQVGAGADSPA